MVSPQTPRAASFRKSSGGKRCSRSQRRTASRGISAATKRRSVSRRMETCSGSSAKYTLGSASAPGPAPAVEEGELLDRAPGDRAVAPQQRVADRHRRGGAPRLRDLEQLAHLRLALAEQRRQHAAEALGAAGEQCVLHGG